MNTHRIYMKILFTFLPVVCFAAQINMSRSLALNQGIESGINDSDKKEQKVRLLTNPAFEKIIFETNLEGQTMMKVKIFDVIGNKVKEDNFILEGGKVKTEIGKHDIMPGLYVIQFEYNGKIKSFRIAIK